MDILKETKYLAFVLVPNEDKRKTKVVAIINKNHQEIIGEVRWFSRWRQYCFFPATDTTWNVNCIQDIGDFIGELNDERKHG